MKKNIRLLSFVLLLCVLISAFVSCNTPQTVETSNQPGDNGLSTVIPTPETTGATPGELTLTPETTQGQFVDYAGDLKLDMNSSSAKQEVTVKTYIDGDTTHFHVPKTIAESGVLKARYLAINTPESTGKIEEWGKTASSFTKEKLSNASSIIIESDDENWNLDSTGGRHLVWIWYKTSADSDYKNLNLEILQNGLAIASNSANNRYGSVCMSAIDQAKAFKLYIYSGQKDPNFYYGSAIELTLKELRTNIEKYNGCQVAFEGVITKDYNNGVYVEDYDEDTGIYYGIYIYYGFGASGDVLRILSVGNRSRIVGTVSYYETGGTYQVSGLSYRTIKPNDPGNVQLISEGHEPGYLLTDSNTFINGKVEVDIENEDGDIEKKTFGYAQAAIGSSISMNNLVVKSIYTTKNEESSSKGAMTITCECNGVTVDVRTVVLYDENKNLITDREYLGKTLNVKGIIDYFDGAYQIKVFSAKDITIVK